MRTRRHVDGRQLQPTNLLPAPLWWEWGSKHSAVLSRPR